MISGVRMVRWASVLVLLGGLTAGCSDDDGPPPELTVTVTDWNGWDRDHEPTPELHVLLGEPGERVEIAMIGELRVAEVDDDVITLRTAEQVAPRGESGGISLTDLEDEFVLEEGGRVAFSSPTLDAGINVEVEWR